jgi:hypothetical protein
MKITIRPKKKDLPYLNETLKDIAKKERLSDGTYRKVVIDNSRTVKKDIVMADGYSTKEVYDSLLSTMSEHGECIKQYTQCDCEGCLEDDTEDLEDKGV